MKDCNIIVVSACAILSFTACASAPHNPPYSLSGPASDHRTYRIIQEGDDYYVTRLEREDVTSCRGGGEGGQRGGTRIDFPAKGTLFGGATSEQTKALFDLMADSRNILVGEMDNLSGEMKNETGALRKELQSSVSGVKANAASLSARFDEVKTTVQQTLREVGALKGATDSLKAVVDDLAVRVGEGEVTVFFPPGLVSLSQGSPEYTRLVSFLDAVGRAGRGRKVLLTVIGNASAPGPDSFNAGLAKRRASFAASVIEKVLVAIPHEVSRVYGTGESLAQGDHDQVRRRSVRVIASFKAGDFPELPAEVKSEALRPVRRLTRHKARAAKPENIEKAAIEHDHTGAEEKTKGTEPGAKGQEKSLGSTEDEISAQRSRLQSGPEPSQPIPNMNILTPRKR